MHSFLHPSVTHFLRAFSDTVCRTHPAEDVTVALEEQSAASLRRLPRALAEVSRTEGDVKHLASSVETILHKLEVSCSLREVASSATSRRVCANRRRESRSPVSHGSSNASPPPAPLQSAEATSAASVASLAAVDKVKRRMVRSPLFSPTRPRSTRTLCARSLQASCAQSILPCSRNQRRNHSTATVHL